MIIIDLDNCLCDDRWRLPLIRREHPNGFIRYHDYHMAIPGDQPANLTVMEGHKVIIMTGRPETYRWLTEEWLERHKISYQRLMMRSKGDFRPSPVVKEEMFQYLRMPITMFDHAYDDRPDVVAMYLNLGLHAEVLAVHPLDEQEHP